MDTLVYAAGLPILIKKLGRVDYLNCYQAMQRFTLQRDEHTPDEIWLVEHPPVYTQGLKGEARHLLVAQPEIPLIQTDRGGQITYHGPGQWVIYPLLNLKRRQLGVKALVKLLEDTGIALLKHYQITALSRDDAPGLYVKGQKIASLGLKIKRQSSYHGLAINVAMDLNPFQSITPCGLEGMQMTQMQDHVPELDLEQVGDQLITQLIAALHLQGSSSL